MLSTVGRPLRTTLLLFLLGCMGMLLLMLCSCLDDVDGIVPSGRARRGPR